MTRRQFLFLLVVMLLGLVVPKKYNVYLPTIQQPVERKTVKSGLVFPITFPISF